MFELLVSGDAIVPDLDVAAALCTEEWGLPPVQKSWVVAPPGTGAKWCFARLQHDRRLAPTALEILAIPYNAPAPSERPEGYSYLPEIAAAQGDRPARSHSTVVSTDDVHAVAARVAEAGGEYRVDGPDDMLPFPRLWVGYTPARPDVYDPTTDAGLRLEVIPHAPLAMPPREPHAVQGPVDEGAPVRMVARTILVADLGAALTALETYFGWEPDLLVTEAEDVLRARFEFPYPRSAALELVQPVDENSQEGRFLAANGPGPFSVRIAVNGLDVLAQRLVAEGAPHHMLPAIDAAEGRRLFRPAERALGTAFEFVEHLHK